MNRFIKLNNEDLKHTAEAYEEFIELCELDKRFVKSDEIRRTIGIRPRAFRRMVEDVLHLYTRGLLPKMIVGTAHGYIYTNDVDLIQNEINHRVAQFKSIAYNWYKVQKKISNNDNLTLEDFLK